MAMDPIVIEFLYLDLTTCTRCVGTGENLSKGVGIVRDVLEGAGTAVEVRRTLVRTAEQARELRFVSSPTIRVNGRDIALELKESPCGSEPCGCGCDEDTLCRVWTYRGQEYTEAPVGLIVDAILGEIYGGATSAPMRETRYALPCCSAEQRESCCEPSEKADCCGPSSVGGCSCQ
jgi:hypothetical protein